MTGEVTLYGEVLPIGGLKEKLLAALRAGIKTVIIPDKNVKDLEDIPSEIKNALQIIPVKVVDEALDIALEYKPIPIIAEKNLVKTESIVADKISLKPTAKARKNYNRENSKH